MKNNKIKVSLSVHDFYGKTHFVVDFGDKTETVETNLTAINTAMNVSKVLFSKHAEGDLDYSMTPAQYNKFITVINSYK